jgi:hypothetical protein
MATNAFTMVLAYNSACFDSAFPAARFASIEKMCAAPAVMARNTIIARLDAGTTNVACLWVNERQSRVVQLAGHAR